jgi:hypothetical protein
MKYVISSLFIATTAFADVSVTAAPPIESAPRSGLDPDVVARLDSVERDLATANPEQLLARTLVLYQSQDPFSEAQRDAAKPRTLALLTKIGEAAKSRGDVVVAARAFDARWTISGTRDPALAQVLTTWAERDAAAQPGRALYLARRARRADPDDRHAAELDDDLGRNHRLFTGKAAVVVGILACAAGLYAYSQVHSIESDLATKVRSGSELDSMLAERDMYHWISTGLFIAAPTLTIGGIVLMVSGTPHYSPESPEELPTMGAK